MCNYENIGKKQTKKKLKAFFKIFFFLFGQNINKM